MGKNTEISWTTHTFNPWVGCSKVSPACTNCYAEAWAKRSGLVKWGDSAERRRTSESNWRQPLKWNREAEAAGERRRVFCASLADVFEDRAELIPWRDELFQLIDRTPNLDWLLLTKRPQNIAPLWPFGWYGTNFSWQNIWIGTTVENQEYADLRIPSLLDIPAKVRFLSVEPLLGPIDLSRGNWIGGAECYCGDFVVGDHGPLGKDACRICRCAGVREPFSREENRRIDWVIVGGESGAGSRPMNPQWVRLLREQCQAAGVAFHFKQWGNYRRVTPYSMYNEWCDDEYQVHIVKDELKSIARDGDNFYLRMDKHAAGRLLDGREWLEIPSAL